MYMFLKIEFRKEAISIDGWTNRMIEMRCVESWGVYEGYMPMRIQIRLGICPLPLFIIQVSVETSSHGGHRAADPKTILSLVIL